MSRDLVALYGSLMQGLDGRSALGPGPGLRFLRPCTIPGVLFDLGPYPGLRPGSGRVRGELYRIDAPTLLERLDEFEGFEPDEPDGSLYLRRRLRLIDPEGKEAWVYVYNAEPAPESRIESGDWRDHLARRA